MRLLPSSPRKIEVSTSFSMEMQPHDCVNAKVSLQLSWPDGGVMLYVCSHVWLGHM